MIAGTLAEGIGFTEGPLWTTDQRLLVVALSRGAVVEIGLEGGVRRSIDVGGGPNGLAEDESGTVWVAQNGGAVRTSSSTRPAQAGLQRIGPTASVDDLPVTGAQAPNDLAIGPDGRLWFTDPGPPGSTTHGRVLALDRDSGAVDVVLADVDYPNGLTFSGDDLFLAQTSRGIVSRHRWDGERLRPAGEPLVLPEGGPDGLALDVEGRLYAASPDANSIVVFGPDGAVEEKLGFSEPTFPTNLCFAGPDFDLLVVTAGKGGRVLLCERSSDVPGLPLGWGSS
ncbi:SMP-30/gluconolactonase/LRE family protein [Pseudonocardia nematodicida]|uniref:SMP-30/gluconolactonase/LRE family protein n=1 Tax=Pseudonocardia nematodicida TaxID=1206997 RepID=A0ABV1KG70_9PSEU